MTVNGKIDVDGTEGEEVVFTSFYDDSYGGDWNSDGDETVPSRGNWGQIQVNGSGEFDYCRLRYGGAGNYQNANLKFYNTNSSYFSNGVSEYSANHGIYPHGSTITISGSLFEHNGLDGVWSRNATTTINNCEFNNNDRWAA